MLNWLRRILRTDEQLVEDIEDEFHDRISELESQVNDLHVMFADLSDKVYPTLKKLNSRAAVRESREKDINEDIPRKGGIVKQWDSSALSRK